MAQQDDQERDLPATEQKIRKAREDGNVPRSRELAGGVVLISGVALLFMTGEAFVLAAKDLLSNSLVLERQHAFDTKYMGLQFVALLQSSLYMLVPLFFVVYAAAFFANVIIGGLNWSVKPLAPKFSKLNPIKGFKNIFSVHGLAELFKAVLKSVALGTTGYILLMQDIDKFSALAAMPLNHAMSSLAEVVIFDALILAIVFFLIVLVDVPYQLWKYYKELRMNFEEIKRESKDSEGDPYLKGKIRSIQREAARKRMMASVPTADVVVTNPTHYSVALQYTQNGQGAPKVLAKGSGKTALRIREIAAENNVPQVEAPPLARALFAHVELEQEIPQALYTAVAKVLAFVYAMAQGNCEFVALPTAKDIPAGLDPLEDRV